METAERIMRRLNEGEGVLTKNSEFEKAIKSGSQEEIGRFFRQLACHLIEHYEKLGMTESDVDGAVESAFKALKKFDPDLGRPNAFFITTMMCHLRQVYRNRKARP